MRRTQLWGAMPLAIVGLLSLGSVARAQWTVTNLHPVGATYSVAIAASGGQQVGYAFVGGVIRASLWSGTAASWVDLHPPGATQSAAIAASGGQQAGFVTGHASLWSGTAASWVDLHPAGATQSGAYATSGGQQTGYAAVGGVARASLWSGTAASWVDLHPAGATSSGAWAISGGQQAGQAAVGVGGAPHASLWSGTAASWVDLHPAGATSSRVGAISGGQQAGRATVGGIDRASLWSGTAASWVDLHPVGATFSSVEAMSGGLQAGMVRVGELLRASLWSGTADSWVDLHAFLPVGYEESGAYGVSSDGVNVYVTGYGVKAGTYEALLWTLPLTPKLAAKLFFLDFIGARPTQAVVEFRTPGSTQAVSSPTVTVAPDGTFVAYTPAAGVWDVSIKVTHWLRRTIRLNLTSDVSGVQFRLANGDIDGSNLIDSDDFDLLVGNFGTAGPTGDLDGSGLVDSDDFDILVENFGQSGDE